MLSLLNPLFLINGALGAGVLYVLVLLVTKGVPWTWAKLSGIWSTVKDDVTAAEKFLNVQNDVAILKADLVVVKQKLGL